MFIIIRNSFSTNMSLDKMRFQYLDNQKLDSFSSLKQLKDEKVMKEHVLHMMRKAR